MNHKKIYEKIIEKAKSENRQKLARNNKNYIYYENHHILPKCLGGLDIEDNLVLLIPKEHCLAHKLLTYIYKGNLKIAQAFFLMTFSKRRKCRVSLRDYAYAKELINTLPALEVSEETRKKISKMLKLPPEERIAYKKAYKKKEQENKKLNKWFEKNCSEKAIQKYLDSFKNTHYSPSEDLIIHISLNRETKTSEPIIEKIKEDMKRLNKQGCYVGTKV